MPNSKGGALVFLFFVLPATTPIILFPETSFWVASKLFYQAPRNHFYPRQVKQFTRIHFTRIHYLILRFLRFCGFCGFRRPCLFTFVISVYKLNYCVAFKSLSVARGISFKFNGSLTFKFFYPPPPPPQHY